MRIDITTKSIELDGPLRVFVDEKIGGLEHLLGSGSKAASAQVEIGRVTRHHKSGKVYYAEVNIKMGSTLLRAQSHHEDLRSAIVDAKDEIQVQIKKFKEKRVESRRKLK